MTSEDAAVARCQHCGVLVEAVGSTFCCTGCELAWGLIHDAGGDRFYATRAQPSARPGATATDEGWAQVAVEPGPDGAVACFRVDGLTCAACAWVVEKVVGATPGVLEAKVALASGRAKVRFEPGSTSLSTIVGRVSALGYHPRPLASAAVDRDLLLRLGVAAFGAMNVMLLSASLYAGWFDGMKAWEAAVFRWASLALATPAALWSAAPLYQRAWNGLRHGILHVDLPVSIGIGAMYVHGVWATLHGTDGWLDSLTMLVALLLGGRVVEQGHRRRAQEAATALAGQLPARARRFDGERVVEVDTASLVPGDRVEVATGGQVPADGVVEAGDAWVRRAVVTGEADAVHLGPGEAVHAGTVVEGGWLRFRLDRPVGETLLARAARLVGEAADRPSAGWLTDRVAPWFTLATLVLAGVAFVAWQGAGLERAVAVTMAVLVVACPCALALAAPLANAAGLGAAGRRGLLVRSGDVLSTLAEVEVVAFDKTGTLTVGQPRVVAAEPEVLRVAAGLERGSNHPIARAVLAAAAAAGVPLPEAAGVHETPGVGVEGLVDGRRWSILRAGPGTVRVVGEAGELGTIRLEDVVRPDAAATVASLRQAGLRVVLLSGDHEDVVRALGAQLGVEAHGGLGPEEKAAWLRGAGARVLFAGDGLNDGPALAAADVAVAMGEGVPSSVLVADAVVAGEGLAPLLAGVRVARVVRGIVRGNVARSIVYNAVAVACALAGFVNPLVAAVAMPLSSGLVVWGASRVEPRTRALEA